MTVDRTDLHIVSHHPFELLGGVTASIRVVLGLPDVRSTWHTTTSAEMPACDTGTWIFNGGFALDVGWGLDLLEARTREGHLSYVYWHEAGVGLSRLLGRPIIGEPAVHRRQERAHRVLRAALQPQVVHLAASGVTKVALTAALGVDPRDTHIIYEAIQVGDGRRRVRPDSELRLCSAGLGDPRKNASAFVNLARHHQTVLGVPAIWRWYGVDELDGADGVIECAGIVDPLQPALSVSEDVYLSLSFDDPLSVAALEALGAGIPVVCLSGTGLAEVLPPDWSTSDVCGALDIVISWLESGWPTDQDCLGIAQRFTAERLLRRIEMVGEVVTNRR
jgi:hypothetical protein